jgi:hypothetical protein
LSQTFERCPHWLREFEASSTAAERSSSSSSGTPHLSLTGRSGRALLVLVALITVAAGAGLSLIARTTAGAGTPDTQLGIHQPTAAPPTTLPLPVVPPIPPSIEVGAPAGRAAARVVQSTPVAVPTTPTAASDTPPRWTRTLMDDDFTGAKPDWRSDRNSTAWLAEGSYSLFAREPGRFVAMRAPLPEPLRDVLVSGTFRKTGGPDGGGYGLIVRAQGAEPLDGVSQTGRYYVLEAGDLGQTGVWRREGSEWVDLLPWTPSPAVRPGTATNILTVEAVGERLTFSVNGAQVTSLTDSAVADGAVGVFVGGDGNQVALERFVVQTP